MCAKFFIFFCASAVTAMDAVAGDQASTCICSDLQNCLEAEKQALEDCHASCKVHIPEAAQTCFDTVQMGFANMAKDAANCLFNPENGLCVAAPEPANLESANQESANLEPANQESAILEPENQEPVNPEVARKRRNDQPNGEQMKDPQGAPQNDGMDQAPLGQMNAFQPRAQGAPQRKEMGQMPRGQMKETQPRSQGAPQRNRVGQMPRGKMKQSQPRGKAAPPRNEEDQMEESELRGQGPPQYDKMGQAPHEQLQELQPYFDCLRTCKNQTASEEKRRKKRQWNRGQEVEYANGWHHEGHGKQMFDHLSKCEMAANCTINPQAPMKAFGACKPVRTAEESNQLQGTGIQEELCSCIYQALNKNDNEKAACHKPPRGNWGGRPKEGCNGRGGEGPGGITPEWQGSGGEGRGWQGAGGAGGGWQGRGGKGRENEGHWVCGECKWWSPKDRKD